MKNIYRVFFGLFCGVFTSWMFLSQAGSTGLLFSKAIDNYYRTNMLYDQALNAYSTVIMSGAATNEVFTYKQILNEDDVGEFIKATVKEIESLEDRNH